MFCASCEGDREVLAGGHHPAPTSETPSGPRPGRQTERGSLNQAPRRLAKNEGLQELLEEVNLVYLGLWPMIDAARLRCSRVRAAPGDDGDDPESSIRGL